MTLSVTSVSDSENSLELVYVPWGTVLKKVSKLLYVMGMTDDIPLDKRWAKRGREAICTISFVILQVISGSKHDEQVQMRGNGQPRTKSASVPPYSLDRRDPFLQWRRR